MKLEVCSTFPCLEPCDEMDSWKDFFHKHQFILYRKVDRKKQIIAEATVVTIPIDEIRTSSFVLSEFTDVYSMELEVTIDQYFDEEARAIDGQPCDTVFFLECIRSAEKGKGSVLLTMIHKYLHGRNALWLLYAHPIHPERGKFYNQRDVIKYLPKLHRFYEAHGYSQLELNRQVMYRRP